MTYSYRYDLFLLTLRLDPYHKRALSLSTTLSKEVGGAAAPPLLTTGDMKWNDL